VKISVNLATRPFVELRPFFLRLRVLMGALALAAIALMLTAHLLQQRLDSAQQEMDRLKARTAHAQQEKLSNERRMRQPANSAVLKRAQFLNALFLRKSFSWTAVMMDLETVLPSGVQVTSIEPQIAASGDVVIRLRVSGERDRAVQLVRNLERSRRFLQPRLTGETVQAKEPGQSTAGGFSPAGGGTAPAGVEFEILADYNPLPEGESYAHAKTAEEKADAVTGQRLTPAPVKPAPVTPGPHDGIVLKPYVLHPIQSAHPGVPGPNGGPR
jgi:type IV pilus assembly protein PilN